MGTNGGTSQDTKRSDTIKSLITVIFLFVFYPVGIIVMWFLTKWLTWLKIVLSALLILWFLLVPFILAGILIGINPAKQFAQANNTVRDQNVYALLNAVNQYAIDNSGETTALNIGSVATPISDEASGVGDIFCTELVPEYMSSLPVDPSKKDLSISESECTRGSWDTGYTIQRNANNTITISAPLAELEQTISATR